MTIGTVKFYNVAKGYGFISRSDGRDVFVHATALEAAGLQKLDTGEWVTFEVRTGARGDHAAEVHLA